METTPIAKRRSFTASPLTKKKIVSVMDQLLAFNQRLLEEDEVNPTETEFALICFHVDSLFREHFVGDVGKFQQRFQLYKCQIEFVQTLLVLLKDRLPQEALLFCINAMFHGRTAQRISDELAAMFDESLTVLCKLLNRDHRKLLAANLIEALLGLCTGGTEFSANKGCAPVTLGDDENAPPEALVPSFTLKPRVFSIRDDAEVKVALARWIVRHVVYELPDFKTLSPQDASRLWLSVIHFAADLTQPDLACLCFRAAHRLITAGYVDAFCTIQMLDIVFARTEKEFRVADSQQSSALDDAIAACMQLLDELLFNSKSESLANELDCGMLFDLIDRDLQICLRFPESSSSFRRFAVASMNIFEGVVERFPDGIESAPASLAEQLGKLAGTYFDVATNLFETGFTWPKHSLPTFLRLVHFCGKLPAVMTYVDTTPMDISLDFAELLRHTEKRRVVLSALVSLPDAAEKFVPSETQLLSVVQEMIKDDLSDLSDILRFMDRITSLVEFYQGTEDTVLIFLSLPWLDILGNDTAQFGNKVGRILGAIKQQCAGTYPLLAAPELQASTLSALSRVTYGSNWRASILRQALCNGNSDTQLSALSIIPSFMKTMNPISVMAVLDEYISSKDFDFRSDHTQLELAKAAFTCVQQAVCAQDADTTLNDSVQHCKVCGKSGVNKRTFNWKVTQPLEALTEKILNDSLADMELKIACTTMIHSIIKHVSANEMSVCRMLTSSLGLLREVEDISASLTACLEELVVIDLDDVVFSTLKDALLALDDLSLKPRAQILCLFAKYAGHGPTRLDCFRQLIAFTVVRWRPTSLLSNKSTEVISYLCNQYGISSTLLFRRKGRRIAETVCYQLLEMLASVRQHEAYRDRLEETCTMIIDNCILQMSQLFSANHSNVKATALRSFLEEAAVYLVPHLVQCKGSRVLEARVVIKRFCSVLAQTESATILNCFPAILEHWLRPRTEGMGTKRDLTEYLAFFDPSLDKHEFYGKRYYPCTVCVLLNLSVDEAAALTVLEELYRITKHSAKFSFTDAVRDRFLGVLLEFRRAITSENDDDDRKAEVMRSLSLIIQKLSDDFFNQTASKTLMVLKASIPLGEACIPTWITFVKKLKDVELISLVPHIMFAVSPLLSTKPAKQLLQLIFHQRSNKLSAFASQRLYRALLVLSDGQVSLDEYLPQHRTPESQESLLKGCAEMLTEQGPELYQLILSKMQDLLTSTDVDDALSSQLVNSLLHALRKSDSAQTRRMIGHCLGSIGAIDPGRMKTTAETTARAASPTFVTDRVKFYQEFLETCVRWYSDCSDSEAVDQLCYCIQKNVKEIMAQGDLGEEVMSSLGDAVVREIEPFRSTNFVLCDDEAPAEIRLQVPAKHVDSYDLWVASTYRYFAEKIKDAVLRSILRSMLVVHDTMGATRFMSPLIANIILQVLVDNDESSKAQAHNELCAVFEAVISQVGWAKKAAHTCFSVLDFLGSYCGSSASASSQDSQVVMQFLTSVLNNLNADGIPICALAAERCNCSCRALKWLETFGMKNDPKTPCGVSFNKEQFYFLEKLYTRLEDVDGVVGTFGSIERHVYPSPREQILLFEMCGNYADALPLYQSLQDEKLPLVKCLLRLNQPSLALANVESLLKSESDASMQAVLRDYQMEATWRLADWDQLDVQLAKRADAGPATWGANLASLMSSVKSRKADSLEWRLDRARDGVMDALTTLTLQEADTYAQAYKHILRLHILHEVDQVRNLSTFAANVCSLSSLAENWKKRVESVSYCYTAMEPILFARRQMFHAMATTDASREICLSHLESCRLARRAEHLQTAWSSLVAARQLNVESVAVDMEESRYLFQKGCQSQAISILRNAIQNNFPEMAQEVAEQLKFRFTRKKTTFTELDKQFVEAELLLADFMQKAGAASADDLLPIYVALESYGEKSEDFFYRYALFYDKYYCSAKEIPLGHVSRLIQLYTSTLEQGRTHLFHAMPRMLTVWLDHRPLHRNKTPDPPAKGKQPVSKIKSMPVFKVHDNNSDPNDYIRAAFETLNRYYFYTAFAQLISRITHEEQTIYQLLKTILADLIVAYPHQCMWRSIAVYRSQKKATKCADLYGVAKRKSSRVDIEQLVNDYAFVADQFMVVAEHKSKSAPGKFSKVFPEFAQFFTAQKRTKDARMSSRGSPKVLLPFVDITEKQEKRLPPQAMFFSQINLESRAQEADGVFESDEIFIQSISDDYRVMHSLEQPKKLTLVGTDGKRYAVLCKGKDELRKDARLMDVSRVLNSLFIRDADARRRRLSIRTYTVIPLQEYGGIIEWIDNLLPFGSAVKTIMREKGAAVMSSVEAFKIWRPDATEEERIKLFREQFYPRHPLCMAEWIRRTFPEPSTWYAARQAYTRTAAVMSMVGFILGLGDRHCENILLDTTTGEVFHVDFNILFDKGESLGVPEVVPFRLTRNLIDGFGPTGVEGAFRKSCEAAMGVMRNEQEMIATVLETFVHDPLLEWARLESRNQQIRQRGDQLTGRLNVAQQEAHETIRLIRRRLSGNIVTARIYRSELDAPPMSVEGQVSKLIQLASDESNLARMYIGWNPFV